MPIYTYKCPKCGATVQEVRTVADRDVSPPCVPCLTWMDRIPEGPPVHSSSWGWHGEAVKPMPRGGK